MAKKKLKIEKETRKLIEAISDLVKHKSSKGPNRRYKFKTKKRKEIKRVKQTCFHWLIRKGKPVPAVDDSFDKPGYFKCRVCGCEFPKDPLTDYKSIVNTMTEITNQMQFWSVAMGGDSSDTKMFIKLKSSLKTFNKASGNIVKAMNKRAAFESNKANTDTGAFSSFGGYSYR